MTERDPVIRHNRMRPGQAITPSRAALLALVNSSDDDGSPRRLGGR